MPHGRVRACPDQRYKADGRLRESRGPDMSGPYLHYDSPCPFIAKQTPTPVRGLRAAPGWGCGIQTALKKIAAVEIVDA